MLVSSVGSVHRCLNGVGALLDSTKVDDRDDEAVNSKNTSHDTRDQGLEDELVGDDGNGADAYTRLCSPVSSTKVSEDKGRGDTHESEEGVLVSRSQQLVGGILALTHLFISSASRNSILASARVGCLITDCSH